MERGGWAARALRLHRDRGCASASLGTVVSVCTSQAAGIGRPYTWGLTAYGQEGVERVLEILNAELTMTMRQCGTPAVAQITRAHVRHV